MWTKYNILLYSILPFNHDCDITPNSGVYLGHVEDSYLYCPNIFENNCFGLCVYIC